MADHKQSEGTGVLQQISAMLCVCFLFFHGYVDINFLRNSVINLQMIDEFTDVNKGEKELMKLWNTFSMQNKYEN